MKIKMNEELFKQTDEDELHFKRQFAIQFLASWSATHFTEYCARGMQEELAMPPVEDAKYLAQTAWDHWCFVNF